MEHLNIEQYTLYSLQWILADKNTHSYHSHLVIYYCC